MPKKILPKTKNKVNSNQNGPKTNTKTSAADQLNDKLNIDQLNAKKTNIEQSKIDQIITAPQDISKISESGESISSLEAKAETEPRVESKKDSDLKTEILSKVNQYLSKIQSTLGSQIVKIDSWLNQKYGQQWKSIKQSSIKTFEHIPESAKVFTTLIVTAGLGIASLSLASSIYAPDSGPAIASAQEECRKYFPAGSITELSASGLKCVATIDLGDGSGCGKTIYTDGYDVLADYGSKCTVRTKVDVLKSVNNEQAADKCPDTTAFLEGVGCITRQECIDKYDGILSNDQSNTRGSYSFICNPRKSVTSPTQTATNTQPTSSGSKGSAGSATGEAAVCNPLYPIGVIVGPVIRTEDGRCLAQVVASVCNDGGSYRSGGYEIQPNVTPEGNCNVMAPKPGSPAPAQGGNNNQPPTTTSENQGYPARATGDSLICNSLFPVGVLDGPIIRPEDGRCLVQISKSVCDSGTAYRTGSYEISKLPNGNCYVMAPKPGSPATTQTNQNTATGSSCPDGQTVSNGRCIAGGGTPTNNCVAPKDQFYAPTNECLSRDQLFWRQKGYTGPLSGQGHLNCYIVGAPVGVTDPGGSSTKGKPYGCNADGTTKIACDNVSRYMNASVGGFDPGAPSCAVTTGQVTCNPTSVTKGSPTICQVSGISLPDNAENSNASATIDGQTFPCGVNKSAASGSIRVTGYNCNIDTTNLNPGSKPVSINGNTGSFTITAPAVTSCPSGQYLNGNACATCPAGNFCAGGANQPSQCPAGTYCDGGNTQNGGSKPPVACPSGTTSPAGATSSSQCVSTTTPVTKTPLTNDDLKNTNLTCQPASVNSTTTCTFTLPGDKTLPNDLKLGVGDATPGGNCTLNGSVVSCTNVPTGSQPGNQPIYSQIGSTPKSDTGKKVVISDTAQPKTPLTPVDLKNTNLTCQPAQANSTTTCTFTLPNNKTLPSDLKLGIGDASPDGTCTLNSSNNVVTCTNIPTGSQTGTQPIFGQTGSNPKNDTTKKAEIGGAAKDITMDNIGNSTDCNTQKDVTIGQTYTCQFPIINGPVKLPDAGLFAKTVDGQDKKGGSGSCKLQSSTVLVCSQIPTQSLSEGQAKVELGIGNSFSSPTQKGSVRLVGTSSSDFTIGVTPTPSTIQVGQSIQFVGQTVPAVPSKLCIFTVSTPSGKSGKIQATTDATGRCAVTINNQGKLADSDISRLANTNTFGSILVEAQTSGASIVSGDLVGMSSQTGSGSVNLQIDTKSANANWNVVATNTGATARTGGANILTVFGVIAVMGSFVGAIYYTFARLAPKTLGYKKLK